VALSRGGFHTIVKDSNDNVWAFGSNQFGQLGIGITEQQISPILLPESFSKILGVRLVKAKSARK